MEPKNPMYSKLHFQATINSYVNYYLMLQYTLQNIPCDFICNNFAIHGATSHPKANCSMTKLECV